ncbi:GNAT family N-acetyltransferase [Enterovibrio coralii]|uniref:N-acetyltransferase domain-containing protein n=1 Tax=Enterovibrio coralii TaxID=294935 RepID=A0A135IAH6_9GAMM|nr:GNAT family N-acetyltransferase [Enterovibrio coralii]KXF82384.1 hypothetical protein ATN88_09620 [Enterovibrio coralii]
MTICIFEPLSLEHCEALLNFEIKNRAWFERYIAPRPPHFFDLHGLTRATHTALELQSNLTHRLFVMVDEQQRIVGRANINEIRDDHAVIGYRVCEQAVGKGIATKAVQALIAVCKDELDVDYMLAKTTPHNIGSQKVLAKTGFRYIGRERNAAKIQGRFNDLWLYQFDL